jgi:hypothetical protein
MSVDLPKQLDVSRTVVFLVVFIGVVALVAVGKLPADKLEWILLILIPSPIRTSQETKP